MSLTKSAHSLRSFALTARFARSTGLSALRAIEHRGRVLNHGRACQRCDVLYSLASLGTNACNLYTIYTSIRHEPVTLLMLHAVSLDRSMKIVLKEGEGITIK